MVWHGVRHKEPGRTRRNCGRRKGRRVSSPGRPLLPLNQWDVDFVIPRVDVDIPLGIDPFLLFKSRDPNLAALHVKILESFNAGLDALKRSDSDAARRILSF